MVALSQGLICNKSIFGGVLTTLMNWAVKIFFIRTVIKCALKEEGIVSEILNFSFDVIHTNHKLPKNMKYSNKT